MSWRNVKLFEQSNHDCTWKGHLCFAAAIFPELLPPQRLSEGHTPHEMRIGCRIWRHFDESWEIHCLWHTLGRLRNPYGYGISPIPIIGVKLVYECQPKLLELLVKFFEDQDGCMTQIPQAGLPSFPPQGFHFRSQLRPSLRLLLATSVALIHHLKDL